MHSHLNEKISLIAADSTLYLDLASCSAMLDIRYPGKIDGVRFAE